MSGSNFMMFRKAIEKMTPYEPGEQPRHGERVIKLNTNENPYPPSPRIGRAIAQAVAGDSLRLYPRPMADEFVAAAADMYRFPHPMIVAGNGSDELLAMLFRAVLGPGDAVAYAVPTYLLYDTLAAIQEARAVRIEMDRDFAFPLEKLLAAAAKLTIVCSPNSPSGIEVSRSDLTRLLDGRSHRLVVVDEAYADFGRGRLLDLIRSHPNLIVVRTLSKSFSLAGMRLGLCFAHEPVIRQLLKVKDSYNLSRVAQAAGRAALEDAQWAQRNAERIRRTRADVTAQLLAMGFEVPPSAANFVLARMAGINLSAVAAGLRKRGILVRYFDTALLYDSLRISIGLPAEMKVLIRELAQLAAPLATAQPDGRSANQARPDARRPRASEHARTESETAAVGSASLIADHLRA
jgi:histidinol-phosphate aminotransferase